MLGKKILNVWNNRVKYELEFKRKVTVLKGDSGTGKTNIVNMVTLWLEEGEESGVHLNTNATGVHVLRNSTDWGSVLSGSRGEILLVDEGRRFIFSNEFISLFNKSDCYLVVINRSNLGSLVYSVDEVYGLSTVKRGKYSITKLYNLYEDNETLFKPDKLLTEDSGSGKELLFKCFNFSIISLYGNSNISDCVGNERKKDRYLRLYIIVDGAAFGGYLENLLKLIGDDNNIRLFAPESLEYLILSTPMFRKYCIDELEHTEGYADVRIYLTWERFYTALLRRIAREEFNSVYDKGNLSGIFLSGVLIKQLRAQFKDIIE